MNTPQIQGIIRHLLTIIGMVLALVLPDKISAEMISQGQELLMELIGAAMVLYSFIRSFRAPEKSISGKQYAQMKSSK